MKRLKPGFLIAFGLVFLSGCQLGFDREAMLRAYGAGFKNDSSKPPENPTKPASAEKPLATEKPAIGIDGPASVIPALPSLIPPIQHLPKEGFPGIPPISDHLVKAEGCHSSDLDRFCVGLNYVVFQEQEALLLSEEPVEVPAQVLLQLKAVNQIWERCGIQFQLDQYHPLAPERFRLNFRTSEFHEFEDIRRQFATDSSFLVVVTGAWDRSGVLGTQWANAWTALPGDDTHGSILERPTGGDPNLLAHELGHYLSLEHSKDPTDLMNPVIFPASVQLTPGQCNAARWAASFFWKKMLR